jgi:hypothetical protein
VLLFKKKPLLLAKRKRRKRTFMFYVLCLKGRKLLEVIPRTYASDRETHRGDFCSVKVLVERKKHGKGESFYLQRKRDETWKGLHFLI